MSVLRTEAIQKYSSILVTSVVPK